MRRPNARRLARTAATGAALVLLFGGGDALAAIYRCIGPHGMSFRDKPCPPTERQTRVGAEAAPFAGCFRIEDSVAWDGGAGSWWIRVEAVDGAYVFREMAEIRGGVQQDLQPANLPMHRATVDEIQAAGVQMRLRITSGLVVELPAERERAMGLFNAWDEEGRVRLVADLPFVNGFVQRVACP